MLVETKIILKDFVLSYVQVVLYSSHTYGYSTDTLDLCVYTLYNLHYFNRIWKKKEKFYKSNANS